MELKYSFRPKLIRRVSSIDHHKMKRGFIQHSHAHASYGHEIIYLDYGSLNLMLDGQPVKLNTGEIIFIRGKVFHTFQGENNIPFDYLNVMFRGTLPDFMFNRSFPVTRRMRELLLLLKQEAECRPENYLEMMGSLLTELVILLIRQNNTIPVPFPVRTADLSNRIHYESDRIEKAMTVIRKHYNTLLRVEEVAAAVRISASHLRMLLRQNTGKNFTTLLHEHRVEAAKHLIREEGYTFSEIALKVGFESPAFFFRIFKRHTGMTPKSYARSLG